jgi:uncharacterized protein (DUF2147 family)
MSPCRVLVGQPVNWRMFQGVVALFRGGLPIAALCSALIASTAFASTFSPDAPPTGRWLTADQSAVIQIAPCGNGLCGQIVGIRLAHPGDAMPQDWQGQPQCGLTIIQTTSVTPGNGNTVWNGVVLDPRNGVSHPALLAFDAFRRLILRGYAFLPVFGRSTTWTKYTGQTTPNCRLPG